MIAPTRTTPFDLNVDVAGTTIITITTTLNTVKVGTTEDFTVGLTNDATTQVRTAKQRCRTIKMRPHFKTGWKEVQEDANDS
eukprot:12744165-Ditylum_brightwellii.AAC.1